MSPEVAAILTSAAVTTIGLYITFVRWLPGVLDRREKLWEQRQENQIADAADERQEAIDQRALLKSSTEAQIKVSEAQLVLLTQLIETNAKQAINQESTVGHLAALANADRATERALTANTEELSANTETVNALNKNFDKLLTEGSEPLQKIEVRTEKWERDGIGLDKTASDQLSRIEDIEKEISERIELLKQLLEDAVRTIKKKTQPIPEITSEAAP